MDMTVKKKAEDQVTVDQNCLIDLHLHLDGSLSAASARELARMQNMELPKDDRELKKQLMCPEDCRDLNEYLTMFDLPCRLMQTSGAIEASVYNLCEELKEEGLIYAEIRFAPQKHCQQGLTQDDAVAAAIRGLAKSDFRAQLILCCMRDDHNTAENLETVRLTQNYLKNGVCACDLAGAEALYANERFADVFAEARKRKLLFTIHSGEAAGADSVRTAVLFGAARIGHGIRAAEDESVIQLLTDKGIAIETCPTSNVNTCVYGKVSDMPIPELIGKGVKVTINSDNMSVSNTNVRKELQHTVDAFALSKEDVKKFLLNSANAAFLSDDDKSELIKKIEKEFRQK